MNDKLNVVPRSVAYRIFWFGRQIERAEGNARLLDTKFYGMFDQPAETSEEEWGSVLRSLGLWETYLRTGLDVTSENVVEYVIRGTSNPSSLLSCIELARENANGAVPDEIFIELNQLYIRVKDVSMDEIWRLGLHEFIQEVVRSIHTIGGVVDRRWA